MPVGVDPTGDPLCLGLRLRQIPLLGEGCEFPPKPELDLGGEKPSITGDRIVMDDLAKGSFTLAGNALGRR